MVFENSLLLEIHFISLLLEIHFIKIWQLNISSMFFYMVHAYSTSSNLFYKTTICIPPIALWSDPCRLLKRSTAKFPMRNHHEFWSLKSLRHLYCDWLAQKVLQIYFKLNLCSNLQKLVYFWHLNLFLVIFLSGCPADWKSWKKACFEKFVWKSWQAVYFLLT